MKWHTIYSTCCEHDKLFINSALPIGGKVESDQKDNITGEYFFTLWSDKQQKKPEQTFALWNFLGTPQMSPSFENLWTYHWIVDYCAAISLIYYILNTNEIPGEFSLENMISSHTKKNMLFPHV